jgi:glutaredoxin-related protein
MGNCVKRETGYEFENEQNTTINPVEIMNKINTMKRFWKIRQEKQDYYKSVNVKKDKIMNDINKSNEEDSCYDKRNSSIIT